ncbi:MAG: PulJ/GspJ family protein [Gemmatimonadota bacterium]
MLKASACRGFTTVEVLVALTLGLVVSLAALVLCSSGNRVVADLIQAQASLQELLAASEMWRAEWRGVGHDPVGASGAGITRATAETLEFSADWNGDGGLLPTASNPNERLAHALRPGEWRRGVNGGPRLPLAWPDSARFVYRDTSGADLGPRPEKERIASVEVRAFLRSGGPGFAISWVAARRVRSEGRGPGP